MKLSRRFLLRGAAGRCNVLDMNTTTQPRPIYVKVGSRLYAVAQDGWSPQLGAFVVRDEETGRIVTIPGRDDEAS